MPAQPPSTVELELARQHARAHVRAGLEKSPDSLVRRLGLAREKQWVRQALKLAGEPGLVLDLPCGIGRFWPVLAERGNRVILAADPSQEILGHCAAYHGDDVLLRVRTFQSSVFSIGLPENAVDCIFCMPLFQHLGTREHRMTVLREFHRVSRDTVIVSLWMDGKVMAWHRRRQAMASGQDSQRVLFGKALVEGEFREAGFDIVGHRDFFPGYAMRRLYVLSKNT
ncbi:class I SAM-dependent methyltransferase [Pseudomonas chlororaphis]|nr:class I SAM-dependent methyltransferase [Pseudomonas chlororaphis]